MIVNEQAYDVKIATPIMRSNESALYAGKGQLVVNTDGLILTTKEFMGSSNTIALKWDQLRELRDETATKKRFKANFGGNSGDIVLTINIVSGDPMSLRSLFSSLPESIRSMRCPACGGAIKGDICGQCGKNPKKVNRQQGLLKIGAGILLSAIGLTGTYVSISNNSNGEEYTIYFGLIAVGGAIVLYGLIKLFLGVRLST